MASLSSIAGAFGSVVEDQAVVEGRAAAAQQLGAYGVPAELNPFVAAPRTPPPPIANTANVAAPDQQQPSGIVARLTAFAKQYQRVLLIAGGVALVAGLVLRRKRRK